MSLNFGKIESEYSFEGFDDTSERTDKIMQFAFSPGFAYFFNERWSAELALKGLSYTSIKGKFDEDDEERKTTTLDFGLDSLTPTIGIRVYFVKQ